MNFDLVKNTILMTICGSRAYGMSTPSSDVDIKGVAIPSKEYYFGFLNKFEQADKPTHMKDFYPYLTDEEKSKADEGELEGSIYEISKFFKLAAGCNPNIIDVLFCRDSEVRLITPLGKKIRDNRYLFLSKKARFTYEGYAYSQLKRIESHRKFILNPPTKCPARKDFGLPDHSLIPTDQLLGAQDAITKKINEWEIDFRDLPEADKIYIQSQLENYMLELKIGSEEKFQIAARSLGCSDDFVALMKMERKYRSAKHDWDQYNEWFKNRNPERAELEKKYGLDCKHASHLVRLYKNCRELLETGTITVFREDAKDLLSIKNGSMNYEQLIKFAENESKIIKDLYNSSSLRKSPDINRINNLCIEIIEEFYG